jgi:hypothetical protein
MLLIGFGGALRRSELVALDVADIEETETGLLVMIRRSKTDQEGQGATIGIARGDVAYPVKALRAWLAAAGIEAGPICARSTWRARCGPRGLHPAGLCSGYRVIQGSCGYRFALKRALRRCRVGKVQRHFLYL